MGQITGTWHGRMHAESKLFETRLRAERTRVTANKNARGAVGLSSRHDGIALAGPNNDRYLCVSSKSNFGINGVNGAFFGIHQSEEQELVQEVYKSKGRGTYYTWYVSRLRTEYQMWYHVIRVSICSYTGWIDGVPSCF
jgi:hypothetical protein